MAGTKTDKEKLNHTLEVVANILHKENINDWFIMFGTLLGIVREDECIEGDDDLDIMINCDYQQLRNAFEKRGFIFTSKFGINNSKTILKSEPTEEFGSFDFYFCEVDEIQNWNMYWCGHTIITTPYKDLKQKTFNTKQWRSTTLNLPHNYINKIIKMYGKNWKTPSNSQSKLNIEI